MSKKTEDFNWDDDFDFDFDESTSGSFQAGRLKAGRKAVVEFGGSFLSGIKKSLLDPANQRRILEKNAPKGFTAAFDAVSTGARATKEIYGETKEEFMKSLGDVDGDVKAITAKYGKHIPTRLVDRLEKAAEATAKRTYSEPSEAEELASGLDAILADVAKAQRQSMVVNKKTTTEQTGQIVASQIGTTSAVLTSNKILSNISRNSDLMVGLTTAQAKLQRKHIELTYNQTVLQRQTLDILQQTKDLQIKAFEALIKNTGLPEHIKSTLWEETNRSFKTRLVGIATERATARFGDLFANAVGNIKNNLKDKANGAGGALGSMLSGLSLYSDVGDMLGSRTSRAGGMAGGIAGALLQYQLRKKLGSKYKNDPRFKVYGDNIQNIMTSAPGIFNNLQDQFGGFRSLTELLGIGDLRAHDSALNVKVRGNGIKDLDAHQAYNRKSDIALTEVIPGWLGKMHHLLNVIATGDRNAAAQTYDWERGTFTTQKELLERTHGAMFNKSHVRDSRKQALSIVNGLDSKRELGSKDRAILMRYVIQQANSDVGYVDPAALTNVAKSPIAEIDYGAAERIAEVLSNANNFNNTNQNFINTVNGRTDSIFANANKNATYQSKMAEANSRLKDLRTSLPSGMRSAIEHANVGNIEMLRDTGFVSWDNEAKEWRFDQAKYLDAITTGNLPKSPGFNQGGVGKSGPPSMMRAVPSYSSSTVNVGPSAIAQNDSLGADGYTQFQRDLLEAIEINSAKTSVDVSNQVLEAIRQRLDLGIPTGGASESTQEIKRKSSMFRKLLGATSRIGKSGKSFVSKAMSMQLKMAALPFKMFTGSVSSAANVGSRIYRSIIGSETAKMVSSSSAKFGKMMGDVYINGRDGAVLKLKDIQAGSYFDKASGKAIQSLKDIKGAVTDKFGNMVITEEDYKNGLYTLINGKSFSIVGGAIRAGVGAVKGLLRLNTLPARAMAAVGSKVMSGLRNLRAKANDIYIAGETSPRILGRVMAAGGYFDRSGKVIKSIFDIRGDVLDSEGNVVLSVADMSRGLVDKYGKPFKTTLEKIASRITAPFRLAGNLLKVGGKVAGKLASLNLKVLRSPFTAGKSIYSMIKGSASSELKVSAHTADTVDAIYHLLDQRMPKPKGSWNDRDGSGFRDGSREDVLSRIKPKAGEAPTPEKTASNERRGILGMLMAMVGGIGTVIGTMRSWFGNIFGMMRLAAQTKMATSAFDAIGALAGGRRGRGRGLGRAAAGAGMMAKMKNFTKSGLGKSIGLGTLAGGALLFGNSTLAQGAVSGASDLLSGSDSKAFDANNLGIGDLGGAGGGGGGSSESSGGLGIMDRIMNGVGGGVIGELGAIAAFPLLAGLYNKVQGTKLGGKILPGMVDNTTNKPTSRTGKVLNFLTGTNKGRILTAALTGAGFVGGKHLLTGNGGESLGEEATTSFASTLGLELALATLVPALIGKGRSMYNNRKGGIPTPMGPTAPIRGGSLSKANFTPVTTPRPGMGGVASPAMQNAIAMGQQAKPSLVGPIANAGGAVAGGAAKTGLLGKAAGLGKGIFRNAGLLGTGFAAYDAATTEGSALDKAKAFGTSLLTTAAIGKGFDIGGKMLSGAGRAGLMQGAKGAVGALGRQALWQGARTAGMAALTGIGGFVSAPVVLGALAVAAAGAGLYFGYKKFFGTDKAAIMRYRMAQYGVAHDDQEKVTRIAQLEAIAKKHVKISGKTGDFANSMPYGEVLKIFGVQQGDAEHVQRFTTWFTQRFKPVFIRGLAAYRAIAKGSELEKADDLDKETKIKYLNDIGSLDASTYAILVMPFTSDKASKYDASKVKKEYERAIEKIGHEKGKGEKSLTDRTKESFAQSWDKIKSMANDGWDVTKSALASARDAVVNGASNLGKAVTDTAKAAGKGIVGVVGSAAKAVGTGIGRAVDGVSNFVASMTGSQKQWQMMVYKAFKQAGFSEQQARILTAEIGRENSYNPKYLFGGHADPHKGTNLGMLSWQGDRKPRLIAYLRSMKVIDAAGNITQNQAGLNAQAGFIMWELRNTHKKVGSKFLANANISYQEGAYLIGKHYILWRIDDPKYRAQGIKNRDGFYNMLLKQLGSSDGKGGAPSSDSKPSSNAPAGVKAMAGNIAAGAAANVPGMAKAPVGNGVLLPQYQKSSTAGMSGVVGPVNAGIVVGGVPKNHRAVKAATIATQRAQSKSTGYCAKYVANALQGAGYKFTRQGSAFQYASGPLSSAGFTRIANNGKYQIGDVMVWPAHGGAGGGGRHGHIQIYNGRNWVSDFIQANVRPGKSYANVTPTLWRDSTLLGKTVTGSVAVKGATPSGTDAKPTVSDAKPERPNTAPAKQVAPAASSGNVQRAAPAPRVNTTPRPAAAPTSSSVDTALATSNQNRAQAATQATQAMEEIGREQLKVQRSMLKTLGEIRDRLPPVGKTSPQPTSGQINGDTGRSRTMPISMDLNLN